MPKPEAFLKKKEPEKPMDASQWKAFAMGVLGRPIKVTPRTEE